MQDLLDNMCIETGHRAVLMKDVFIDDLIELMKKAVPPNVDGRGFNDHDTPATNLWEAAGRGIPRSSAAAQQMVGVIKSTNAQV
jgi:hypothetical protein